MIGHFYSMILPGQLFGEASKIVYLNRQKDSTGIRAISSTEQIAASVIVDKITGLTGLLLLGILGVLFGRYTFSADLLITLILITIVFFAMLFGLRWGILYRFSVNMLIFTSKYLKFLSKFALKIKTFIEAWREYLFQPNRVFLSIFWGVIYQMSIAWIQLIAGKYLLLPISFFDWCWISAVLSISMLIPFSIGGIGLREGGYISSLSLFNVSTELALTFSMVIFSSQLLSALIGAIFVISNSSKRNIYEKKQKS
jgi:uncharacterized membrane protein YbhN (UPF0104 family)